MTYLEKAKELRPDLTEKQIKIDLCPSDVNLKNCVQICKQSQANCEICFNREMPEVKNE